MSKNSILFGDQKVKRSQNPVTGKYVEIEGESFYKISNYDNMTPFFMSIVSGSDHWMFVSSNGGLTAGRKNPDNALFPYYTDDIIHTSHETTGSKTIIRIRKNETIYSWEPFSDYYKNIYHCSRHIYKNIPGNKIIFEEVNHDLKIRFLYSWMNSERFGFIKRSRIINEGEERIDVQLLDGIQNILPYGIYQQFQAEFSTLADGYKKNELIEYSGIGVFSLSSIPSDRAEPSESLKATLVWSAAIEVEKYLLSSTQLNSFRLGDEVESEIDIKAQRGAYFINSSFSLNSDENKYWYFLADINKDHKDLAALREIIENQNNLHEEIEKDIEDGTEKLIKIVASADGLQTSNDRLVTSRHFSNVLFNTMRGGIFDDSYTIEKNDFISFIRTANRKLFKIHEEFLNNLDNQTERSKLSQKISNLKDNNLTKLFSEYLPLTFSRRHGDPSRPWNRFSIDIKDKKNQKILNYQGNWRDVFQNWEALALSYPGFLDGMIAKFLNASTADGYNPYRITRDGFDWEIPEPDKPWSNIGYWGDHQIIYLLKLLELSTKFNESELYSNLSNNIYAYANVPYRIKSYKELLEDSQNTIEFDRDLHKEINEKEKSDGSDARFLTAAGGLLFLVNMSEKLLVTLLSKLSNFIPGGGIWMNTQRPEWNDANNALVGNGISMVTLYYLRRYVSFLNEIFSKIQNESVSITEEVSDFLDEISKVLESNKEEISNGVSDEGRKIILDGLGLAGENFRKHIYDNGFSTVKKSMQVKILVDFLHTVQFYIDDTIKSNVRNDGLYHSYNLMSLKNNKEIKIVNLYEMLEGQVAVLSSGYLPIDDSIKVLESLQASNLYREDQNSYILYPDRQLPKFVQKNNIPKDLFESSQLLKDLVSAGNTDIVSMDVKGTFHFNGEISNVNVLKSKILELKSSSYKETVFKDEYKILNIYEEVFNHKAFTGRSGTFYKYEGLGSIYWHMVSKLVLAVQETYYRALAENSDQSDINKLKSFYYELKEGIGIHKSPSDYGAFPTDPYSHTPIFSGVQQPGMTGQVKEDIISRFGELGLIIENNTIRVNTSLLNENEFLNFASDFVYYDTSGIKKSIKLKEKSIGFSYCQVPFIYELDDQNIITAVMKDGKKETNNELSLSDGLSQSIFNRQGLIDRVEVRIKK